MPPPPIRHDPATTPVAVVLGGPSAEHDVSVVSGSAIADALADSGYPTETWLIGLDGAWWRLPDGFRRDGRPEPAFDDPEALGAAGPMTAGPALEAMARRPAPPLVFIALHGPFGEDGTIQALCQAAGLAYTGAGVTASAVGMDKAVFKRLVRGLGLPVVDWVEVRAAAWNREPDRVLAQLEAFAAGTGDPRLMVKPARLGSSLGMTLAHHATERARALDEAFRFDDLALVERYLAGARDLELSVLGSDPEGLELYGPGEVRPGHEFYDYQAKYTPGLSRTILSAEVSPVQRATIHKLGRDTYRSIGAEGFARIDFLLAGDTLVVSEINTIPGFTPISLFPALCAAGGYDFAAVCRRIVDLALERQRRHIDRRLTGTDLPR